MGLLLVSAAMLLAACDASTAPAERPDTAPAAQQATQPASATLADLQAMNFAAYPAEAYTGERRMPDFDGAAREFRVYRALLGEGAAQGPNFAGQFALVQVGCGAGCNATYQIDLATGGVREITFAPSVLDIQNRVDSALLKARWFIRPETLDAPWKCHYQNFVWRDGQLNSLGQAETDGGCADDWPTP